MSNGNWQLMTCDLITYGHGHQIATQSREQDVRLISRKERLALTNNLKFEKQPSSERRRSNTVPKSQHVPAKTEKH